MNDIVFCVAIEIIGLVLLIAGFLVFKKRKDKIQRYRKKDYYDDKKYITKKSSLEIKDDSKNILVLQIKKKVGGS